jgi:hypothetical protein
MADSNLKEAQPYFENASRFRDVAILVGGAAYVIGLVVWGINSYRLGLGSITALNPQYFIAGIVPLFILLLHTFFAGKIIELVRPNFRPTANFRVITVLVMGVVFIGSAYLVFKVFPKIGDNTYFSFAFVYFGLIVIEAIAYFSIERIKELFEELAVLSNVSSVKSVKVPRFIVGMYSLNKFVALTAVVWWYAVLVYPRIPQELGGMRPEYMRIVFDKTFLSEDLAAKISTSGKQCQFCESDILVVFKYDKDGVLFKIPDRIDGDTVFVGETYFMDASSINAFIRVDSVKEGRAILVK